MAPEPVTLPTKEEILTAVPREDVKKNLRVRHGIEDSLIEHWIVTAHSILDGVEGWLRAPILQATYRQRFSRFDRSLELTVANVSAIDSVKYLNAAGDETDIVEAGNWRLYQNGRATYLRFATGFIYPTVLQDEPQPLTVTYTAKRDDVAANAGLKQAIMLLASHWYRNREESFSDPRQALSNHAIQWGLEKALAPFRVPLRLGDG